MTTIATLYEQRQRGNVSDKWSLYLREYDRLFASYTRSVVNFLEIGVQNGGSLDVWLRYFAKGSIIVGCDINPSCGAIHFESAGVALVVGDINQVEVRQAIYAHTPIFDIVIDDGSHTSPDIIQTFCSLFGRVADGGLYVVEDLHCSYWKSFGGGLHHPHSAYAFFKALVDVCNHEHWGLHTQPAEFLSNLGFEVGELAAHLSHIHRIEFLNSLCIVHKQLPVQNRLGLRVVKGSVETVYPIKHLDGQPSPVPDEHDNPYCCPGGTELSTAPPNKLTHDRHDIADLFNESLASRDQTIAQQSQLLQQQDLRQVQMRQELIRVEAQLALLKDLLLNRFDADSI